MAKLEHSAECRCGGKMVTMFKKPTRFQPSIAKAICPGCGSEFMFTYTVEYHKGARAYVPEHKVMYMTKKLEAIAKQKAP